MSYLPTALAEEVRERASHRCEYCRLSQAGQEAAFHIHPRSLGGATTSDNLALACVSCSLRKSAAVDAVDPQTGMREPIFHPRSDTWLDHFRVAPDAAIVGLTPTGRATVNGLRINRPLAVQIRLEEMDRGRYP